MITLDSNGAPHLMDPYNDPILSAPITSDTVTNAYKTAFDASYAGNKAPFGVYMHPTWLVNRPGQTSSSATPDGAPKLAAIQAFLTYAMSKPDVWVVTHQQLLAYMRNPVPASQLGSQPYMLCLPLLTPPTNICNGLGTVGAFTCPNLNIAQFQVIFLYL